MRGSCQKEGLPSIKSSSLVPFPKNNNLEFSEFQSFYQSELFSKRRPDVEISKAHSGFYHPCKFFQLLNGNEAFKIQSSGLLILLERSSQLTNLYLNYSLK
jgi:hypothetical protein